MHACMLSRFSYVRLCGTHGHQPTRLLCPWNSLSKNTRVGCHFLLLRDLQHMLRSQGHILPEAQFTVHLCASPQGWHLWRGEGHMDITGRSPSATCQLCGGLRLLICRVGKTAMAILIIKVVLLIMSK